MSAELSDDVERSTFVQGITKMALELRREQEGDIDRLTEIVIGAVGIVPGCQYAALVVYDKNDQIVARASSGPETGPMIALQNELAEGPCRETAATNVVIRSADVATDLRWPRFASRAGSVGVGSMLCTPLEVGNRTFGSLSLAADLPHQFDDESELLAQVFATHAALALAEAQQIRTLKTALDTRDLIGQAKGVLIGRLGLTADQAFSVLVRESKNANLKLRLVCERLCLTGKLPSDG